MTDQPFVGFSFPSLGVGAVNRTMPSRLNDIFNVRDFGAGGQVNDAPFIQKAIDAAIANNGGIIFFPSYGYNIGTRLTVPGTSDCGLVFQGSGGSPTEGGGTMLNGTIADYILYIGQGSKTPVKSIQGICFGNGYVGGSVVTSTEPPSSGGNGRGGIYLGSGDCVSILNCFVSIASGVGIFAATPNVYISSCTIAGGYPGGTEGVDNILTGPTGGFESYGVVFTSGYFGNCKPYNCGHAMVVLGGPATIENIDAERNGYSVRTGYIPISWWDNAASTLRSAGAFTTFSPTIKNCLGESFGLCFYMLENTIGASLLGCDCQALGQIGNALWGYCLRNVKNSNFVGCSFSGSYQTAGFDMSAAGTEGNTIQLCYGSVGAPHPSTPAFANHTSYAAGENPNIFIASFESMSTGPLTFAQLPPSPSRINSIPILCSDCPFPLWTGTVSNAGRPVSPGGGSNLVPVRWNGAAWVASA